MDEKYGQHYQQFFGTSTGQSQKKEFLNEIRQRREFGEGLGHFSKLFEEHNGTDIHFLIDGSGSMTNKPQGVENTPMNEALTVAYAVTRGVQESRTDAVVSTTLYGNNSKTPPQFSLEDGNVAQVPDFFNSVSSGLHSGSELDNELDALSDVMADIAPERKQEIIILSDGDLYTGKETAGKLAIIKELHPNASINIYTLTSASITGMEKIVDELTERGIDVDYQTEMTAGAVMDEISAKVSGRKAPDRKLKAVLKAASEVRNIFTALSKKMEDLEDKIADYEGKTPKKRDNYKIKGWSGRL